MKPITREMIVEFARKIASHPDVDGININVAFNDGSNINYSSELERVNDDIKGLRGEQEDEADDK